jgi:hypothetical protein
MEKVQLSIGDARYAAALRERLESTGTRTVDCVSVPKADYHGITVVDSDGLSRLPVPLLNPEQIVLITRNDPQHLSAAWNAGIRSVVFPEDPLSTAVLAIMAAGLRAPRPEPNWALPRSAHHPSEEAPAGACGGCGKPVKPVPSMDTVRGPLAARSKETRG